MANKYDSDNALDAMRLLVAQSKNEDSNTDNTEAMADIFADLDLNLSRSYPLPKAWADAGRQ